MIFKLEPLCDIEIMTQIGEKIIWEFYSVGFPFVINTKSISTIFQYREGDISGIKINGVKIPLYDCKNAPVKFWEIKDESEKEKKVSDEWDKNYFKIEEIFNQIVGAIEKEQTNEK